jgi:hypothetical protein
MKVPLHAVRACLTVLVCGCAGQTLDAGSNTDAGVVAPPSGVRWSQPPSNDLGETCTPGGSTSVVGSWLGHFDNYVFPSGSNEIRINLVEADNPADAQNAPCGKIVFGAGDPPPLPTDPTAFYPPGSGPTTTIDLGDAGIVQESQPQRTVYEGFRYDFAGGLDDSDTRVDGQRLELGIMTAQIYKAWCEMQLSYFQGFDEAVLDLNPYSCVPYHNASTGPDSDGGCGIRLSGNSWTDLVPTSCAQLSLCAACQCQPNGCSLANFAPDVHVDIQFQGDTGSGSASFPMDGIQAFTLQRAP